MVMNCQDILKIPDYGPSTKFFIAKSRWMHHEIFCLHAVSVTDKYRIGEVSFVIGQFRADFIGKITSHPE